MGERTRSGSGAGAWSRAHRRCPWRRSLSLRSCCRSAAGAAAGSGGAAAASSAGALARSPASARGTGGASAPASAGAASAGAALANAALAASGPSWPAAAAISPDSGPLPAPSPAAAPLASAAAPSFLRSLCLLCFLCLCLCLFSLASFAAGSAAGAASATGRVASAAASPSIPPRSARSVLGATGQTCTERQCMPGGAPELGYGLLPAVCKAQRRPVQATDSCTGCWPAQSKARVLCQVERSTACLARTGGTSCRCSLDSGRWSSSKYQRHALVFAVPPDAVCRSGAGLWPATLR